MKRIFVFFIGGGLFLFVWGWLASAQQPATYAQITLPSPTPTTLIIILPTPTPTFPSSVSTPTSTPTQIPIVQPSNTPQPTSTTTLTPPPPTATPTPLPTATPSATPTLLPPTPTWTLTPIPLTPTPSATAEITLPSPTPTLPGEIVVPSPTFTPFVFSYPTLSPTRTPRPFGAGELPERNLSIEALEITQGIQDLRNSMPLVAERRTYVRVYVRSDPASMTDVSAQLGVWRGSIQNGVYLGTLSPINGPIIAQPDGGNRLNLDDSLYFLLPSAWTTEGTLTLKAFAYAIDPDIPATTEPIVSDNFYQVSVTFHKANTPEIWFWPLRIHHEYEKYNGWYAFRYNDWPQVFTKIINDIFRYHPIALAQVYAMDTVLEPLMVGAWNLADEDKVGYPLNRLFIKRLFDGRLPNEWYVGMVHFFVRSFEKQAVYDGLARNVADSAWVIMDPLEGSTTRWYIAGGATLAHELGHLTGLKHVACADYDEDGQPDEAKGGEIDTSHPTGMPNCSLAPVDPEGFYGFDVYWDAFGLEAPTVISNAPDAERPHLGFPMMGYRSPPYIDPYHYCYLLNFYGIDCDMEAIFEIPGDAPGPGGHGPKADCKVCAGDTIGCNKGGPGLTPLQFQLELCVTQETLPEPIVFPSDPSAFVVIAGKANTTSGDVVLSDIYMLSPTLLPTGRVAWENLKASLLSASRPSPFWIDMLDDEGRVLTSVPMVAFDTRHGATESFSFSYVLSATTTTTTIVVRTTQGTEITRTRASEHAPSVRIADISADTPEAGAFTITWEATDDDGDALDFLVQVSGTGGETWETVAIGLTQTAYTLSTTQDIPGSTTPLVRVIASDGFHTAADTQVLPAPIPNKPPTPFILSPADGAIFPTHGLVVLTGMASDLEDGVVPSDALTWVSDIDGELGTGAELITTSLSPGQHRITLRATDSTGQVAETTIHLAIDPNVVRPLPAPERVAVAERILREGITLQPVQTPAAARRDAQSAAATSSRQPILWMGLGIVLTLAIVGGLLLWRRRARSERS